MGQDHSHKKDPLVVRLLGLAFLIALPVLLTINFEAFKEVAARKFDLSVVDLIMIPTGTLFFFIFWKIFDKQVCSKYLALFEERELATGGAIESARAIKEEALNLHARYDEELNQARLMAVKDKLSKLDSSRSGASERLSQAENQAADLIAKTRMELQNTVGSIRSDLVKDVDLLAAEIAARIKQEPQIPE